MTGDINKHHQDFPGKFSEGVYAWNSLDNLLRVRWFPEYRVSRWRSETDLLYGYDKFYIIVAGEVELWGEIDVHASGYRASYGYPRAFYENYRGFPMYHDRAQYFSILENVSKRYGVKII